MEPVAECPDRAGGLFRTVVVGVDEHQGGRDATALAKKLLADDGSLIRARVAIRDSLVGRNRSPDMASAESRDEVRLAPQVSLVIASRDLGRSLVLRGGIPMGNSPPSYDFTWAFTVRDGPGDPARLMVRQRYAYSRPWLRMLVEPAEALGFVMSQKMLRGIKDRSEGAAGHHASQARTNESSSPGSAVPAL